MIRSKNEYLSSKKSKELIKHTLLELINNKSIAKPVTVTQLVEKANINRGTFYFHYKNIYEVTKDIEQDITNDLKNLLVANVNEITVKRDASALVYCISNFVKENESIFSYFLSSFEYSYFINKIKTEIIQFILEGFFNPTNRAANISINFYINGFLGLYQDYYNHRIKITYNELNNELIILLNHAFEQ